MLDPLNDCLTRGFHQNYIGVAYMATTFPDLSGEIIDSRYRIECRIGQGGMGIVWQARHVQGRQLFALKTVHGAHSPDRKVFRRLLHEARATAAIQSRNVVRIVDVNPDYIHSGIELPFIVMELLRGCTFSDYLERTSQVDLGELVWITRQVSRALSLAHTRGIVHRDLKPSNVFLAEDDDGNVTAKVCDFGIAKFQGAAIANLADGGTLSTETGALFGTPRYMAPEQLRKAGNATPATDQWALGLLVFRAITGKSYFEGARNLAELILAIVHEPLPMPSQISSLFPQALDDWFLRCCARNPTDRFDTVNIQQQAFEEALGALPERAIDAVKVRQSQPKTTSSSENPTAEFLDSKTAPKSQQRSRISTKALYGCLGLACIATVMATHWLRVRVKPRELSQHIEHALANASMNGLPTKAISVASVASDAAIATIGSIDQSEIKRPSAKKIGLRSSSPRPALGGGLENNRSRSPQLAPRGAACTRSAQCETGLCAAEVCE
jgi:serine/threonine protein kinase